jgi:F-type H+-transporting ATPase subunit b
MNAAKNEASRLRDDIIKQAHEEVLAMRRKNEQQLQEERRVVVRALRADIAQLSIAVAEKIIERSIDKSAHQQLINDLLSKVNEQNLSSHGAGS